MIKNEMQIYSSNLKSFLIAAFFPWMNFSGTAGVSHWGSATTELVIASRDLPAPQPNVSGDKLVGIA